MRKHRSIQPLRVYVILQELDTPKSATELFRIAGLKYGETLALLKTMEEAELITECKSPNERYVRRGACQYVKTVKGKRLQEAVKPLMELK